MVPRSLRWWEWRVWSRRGGMILARAVKPLYSMRQAKGTLRGQVGFFLRMVSRT